MPGGRPSDYNETIATEICRVVSTTPRGLVRLCKDNPHWPDPTTIQLWRITHAEFSVQYTQAKANQVETLVDQCLDITDESGFDAHVNESGRAVCDSEAINRARLRVDTRKWLAAKLAPKLYGEKPPVNPLVTESLMQKVIDKL